MVDQDFRDQTLTWGALRMGPGGAFPMANDLPGELDTPSAPVGKLWIQTPDTGRTFLIEQVEYLSIKPQLELLPRIAAIRNPDANATRMARLFPARPKDAAATRRPMQTAQTIVAGKGLVIDYSLLLTSTNTNTVFKSDTTYFISGTVTLRGTTIIEGGTVLKYTNGSTLGRLVIEGSLDCQTEAFRPAFFTGRDDDAVGEVIAQSTGNLSTNYYGKHLDFSGNTNIVRNHR